MLDLDRMMLVVGVFSSTLILSVSTANAATLNAGTFTNVAVNSPNGPLNTLDTAETVSPETFVSATSGAEAMGPVGIGTALAGASADAVTGELKASTFSSKQLAPGITAGGDANALANASIRETITLNGTGTLTANMLVDVDWNVVASNYQIQADVSLVTGPQDTFALGASSGQSGSVDDVMLSISANYTNVVNQAATLVWRLLVQDLGTPFSGESIINAANTGTIWFETSGGLFATASDSSFLSNAAYPADLANEVVPLPAGAALMLTAIAGFGILRRAKLRRRNTT